MEKRFRDPLRNIPMTIATWMAAGATHRMDCKIACEDICLTCQLQTVLPRLPWEGRKHSPNPDSPQVFFSAKSRLFFYGRARARRPAERYRGSAVGMDDCGYVSWLRGCCCRRQADQSDHRQDRHQEALFHGKGFLTVILEQQRTEYNPMFVKRI